MFYKFYSMTQRVFQTDEHLYVWIFICLLQMRKPKLCKDLHAITATMREIRDDGNDLPSCST